MSDSRIRPTAAVWPNKQGFLQQHIMLTAAETACLQDWEYCMWQTAYRCDAAFQRRHFAVDFIDFGSKRRLGC